MSIEQWQAALQDGGFVFVHAPDMEATLAENGLTGWDAFARSWDDLGLDTYMADGGRYRKRRHAAFAASAAGVVRKPAQPGLFVSRQQARHKEVKRVKILLDTVSTNNRNRFAQSG